MKINKPSVRPYKYVSMTNLTKVDYMGKESQLDCRARAKHDGL